MSYNYQLSINGCGCVECGVDRGGSYAIHFSIDDNLSLPVPMLHTNEHSMFEGLAYTPL